MRVLSKLFRRLDAGEALGRTRAGRLAVLRRPRALGRTKAFAAYLAPLRQERLVRLRQASVRGPEAVLAYLSRYTHRVAISNRRLSPPTTMA